MKLKSLSAVMFVVALAGTTPGWAKVQVKEHSQFKMGGMMGQMAGMFAGKAAKEGIDQTISVDGSLKMTVSDHTGELIDLDQQKIYQIDFKKKSYKVVTFDEMRKQLQELNQKLGNGQEKKDSGKPAKEYDIDFDVQNTGATKNVAGFETHQVKIIVTVREKGQTLVDGGGMVMTSDSWLTDSAEGLSELRDFDRRYAETLYGDLLSTGASQFAALASMYPAMMKAMEKMQAEDVNMQGSPLMTTVSFESVMSRKEMQEQASRKDDEDSSPKSIGGLLGGFGKKLGKKDDSAKPKTPGRDTVLTTTLEVLSVTSDFPADQLAIPAGFKEKR